MATRPRSATAKGVFFAYPQDATGTGGDYWLASSPGDAHKVRMTGDCKGALLLTIEAVIERAVAPATCGSTPGENTDFKAEYLGAGNVPTIISLREWSYSAKRAALGAKLVRGCPKEEWDRLVLLVSELWNVAPCQSNAGIVYAWQVGLLEYDTEGWVGENALTDAACQDLAFSVADESVATGGPIALRLWGDYPGGAGYYPVAEWVANALIALGANISTPSLTPGGFADYELNGNPAPLAVGHEGNWFASTASTMVGQSPSSRRSSSAWAVLQSMLANMRYTHLDFGYEHYFINHRTTHTVQRYVTMDPATGNIQCVEESNTVTTTYEGDTLTISVSSNKSFTDGTATRQVQFFCNDSDVASLAVFVRPADGWRKLGTALMPFLTFGQITNGGARLELECTAPTALGRISAGGSASQYPAVGLRSYVKTYSHAHFVDREEYFKNSQLQWTKYSVRPENGSYDLATPVTTHATWLLGQLPTMPLPSVPACPTTLTAETADFWANWEVYYPATPNVQINGQDAYFPTAFRNNTFAAPTDIQITHVNNAWESGSQYECIFGRGKMAFPDVDNIDYGDQSYVITPYGEAMMGVEWAFKAMTA